MNPNTAQPFYISASQLARKADQPLSKLLRRVHDGSLTPDQTVGSMLLFRADRLNEIKTALNLRHVIA